MAPSTMTTTDPELLISALEKQGCWLTASFAVRGALSGGVLGYLVGPYFGTTPVILGTIFAAAGVLFGFSQGQIRRAELRTEAVHLRLLAQIERNTRRGD